jgi:hypothetical protein
MSRTRLTAGFISKPTSSSFKKLFDELSKQNGFECKKLYYGDEVYYCVRDVLKCLKYSNEEYDISRGLKKLKNLDKFTIIQLQEKYNYTNENDPNKNLLNSLNRYQMKHMYVDNEGMKHILSMVVSPVPNFLLGMCKLLKSNRLSNL